jgi:hypothetical protein
MDTVYVPLSKAPSFLSSNMCLRAIHAETSIATLRRFIQDTLG